METQMYIDSNDLKKLLGTYFSKELKQKIIFNINKDNKNIFFEYRKYDRIKSTPVILSVTLTLDEVKDILSNFCDNYDILNINPIIDSDGIVGFNLKVKEKSNYIVLKKVRNNVCKKNNKK